MSADDFTFDYELPKRLIAQEPLRNRADARLMVVNREEGTIEHHYVRDLPQLMNSSDHLVFNNTKVIPAALQGLRVETGGNWQGLFLEALPDGHWKIICKTRGRLKEGEAITLLDREHRPAIKLWLLESLDEGQWLAHPEGEATHLDVLQQVGRVPLPPYIRGGRMVDADVEDYQTVFARRPGAVAAPTAGLHFTEKILRAIEQQGVLMSAVTLHVGLGTFRPIQSESLDEHKMHSEWGELSSTAASEINQAREKGGSIVAVGTTVVRVLETAIRAAENDKQFCAWTGTTNLFIHPPFEFQAVDALITNFHFPRTTLLVLIQTFAGRELAERAYRTAVREEYRFYSYGDAMLIR